MSGIVASCLLSSYLIIEKYKVRHEFRSPKVTQILSLDPGWHEYKKGPDTFLSGRIDPDYDQIVQIQTPKFGYFRQSGPVRHEENHQQK